MHDVLAGIATSAAHDARIAVLPESSYPGYVLMKRSNSGGFRASERALRTIADAARRSRIDVCVGLALQDADGEIRNEAVYFDRDGRVVARYAKVFLWNFDRRWFAPGRSIDAFDTTFGRLGMMICADGRMPEIARTLARRGAWLILDPTAWVGRGPSYDRMPNPQVEYMMRVRAKENGVWIAAADKCGSELDVVHYVGRSMIVAPDGSTAAAAPADRPAVITTDVLLDRRPHPFFVPLSAPERSALHASPRRTAGRGPAPRFRLGVLQGTLGSRRTEALAALRAQAVDAIVETARSGKSALAALGRVRGLRSAVVDGARMFAPEPARAAALRGADVIVWTGVPRRDDVRDFARTRALENRVFVVVARGGTRRDDKAASLVIDPEGRVVAEGLEGEPSGYALTIDASAAREKQMLPGTNAFLDRIPGAYALFDGTRPPT